MWFTTVFGFGVTVICIVYNVYNDLPNIYNSFKPVLFANGTNLIFSDKSINDLTIIYNVT